MTLSIAERIRPFSHQPGTFCLVPGTLCALQIFPVLLRLFSLRGPSPELLGEYSLDLKGPLKEFTVQADLEKGRVRVWGKEAAGVVRYEIVAKQEEIVLILDKSPHKCLIVREKNREQSLVPKQSMNLLNFAVRAQIGKAEEGQPARCERLSLGSHKAQDWDLIKRRLNVAEIFPIWYRLGQWTSAFLDESIEPALHSLLRKCEETINHNRPERSVALWKELFQAAFQGILVPFWQDECFQGILDPVSSDIHHSPLVILKQGMHLMRRHFIELEEEKVNVLPVLPPELHCGRLLDVQFDDRGVFHLEWTKKTIRRLSFHSLKDQECVFAFKKAARCRLRGSRIEKGEWICSGERLALEKNCHYFFDNFN